MKTKNEICVPIRDEKELQQAKEMLERNGEKICNEYFRLSAIRRNYLKFATFTKDWYLGKKIKSGIPLSELESVLRGESVGQVNKYYSFFKFMSDEHNLTLTDTEMSDIIYEAKKVIEKLKND